ncbi:hypothetical protein N0V85_003875 [Neurospora sp. IMI 360204]|nr:hypothetical protein N0V85_003875 [Neurospora sp. IMI 360204]
MASPTYTIHVQQTISEDALKKDEPKREDSTPTDPSKILNTTPVERRFELPADSVYSIYPEQGHEATHDTLPHIVLNDSTLPWERIGSYQAEDHRPDDYARNRVPWMALLIFSPDELRLDDAEKAGIFAHTSLNEPPPKQLESMAVRVPLGDLVKLKKGTAKVPFGNIDIDQATKPDTNVIFPKAFLFNRLFAAYDDDGKSLPGGPDCMDCGLSCPRISSIFPWVKEDNDRNKTVGTIQWPRRGKGKVKGTAGPSDRSQVFVRGSDAGLNDVRLLLVDKLATDVHATLDKKMEKKWYDDTTATSAMVAYQLSSPSWQLQTECLVVAL